MKVFISWSGPLSRSLAEVIRRYLPCMIQRLDVFMSKHDLESGARWSLQLASELEQTNFGIICLTPENLDSPWLLFEAGALTKHLEGRACALLFCGLTPAGVSGPLAQFQNRAFHKEDFRALLQDIYAKLPDQLEAQQLDMIFEKWWPDIERECDLALKRVKSTEGGAPRREQRDILEEILTRIRDLERNLAHADEGAKTEYATGFQSLSNIPVRNLRNYFSQSIDLLSTNQFKLLRVIANMGAKSFVEFKEDYEKENAEDLHKLVLLGLVMKKGKSYSCHPLMVDVLSRAASDEGGKAES